MPSTGMPSRFPDTNPNDQLFGVPTATIDNPRNLQITGRINFLIVLRSEGQNGAA